jgi:hypothetical protein
MEGLHATHLLDTRNQSTFRREHYDEPRENARRRTVVIDGGIGDEIRQRPTIRKALTVATKISRERGGSIGEIGTLDGGGLAKREGAPAGMPVLPT